MELKYQKNHDFDAEDAKIRTQIVKFTLLVQEYINNKGYEWCELYHKQCFPGPPPWI